MAGFSILGPPGGVRWFDDDELAHHPAVLVLEDVAVEHVRQVGIGVPAEADEQAAALTRRHGDGVLEATEVRRRRHACVVEHPNLTSCGWKLCGVPDALLTSQISVAPVSTTASIRSRSNSLPLIEHTRAHSRWNLVGFTPLTVDACARPCLG
jgi:hypothetical protein